MAQRPMTSKTGWTCSRLPVVNYVDRMPNTLAGNTMPGSYYGVGDIAYVAPWRSDRSGINRRLQPQTQDRAGKS